MMKHIKKIYYLTLFLLIIISVLIFICPNLFSLNFIIVALTILIVLFFVINYFYKKKHNKIGNNTYGIVFFAIMLIYFSYIIYKYFKINPL